MIDVRCHDKKYNESKLFRFTGDGGREDLDELQELEEWLFQHKPSLPKEYLNVVATEGV